MNETKKESNVIYEDVLPGGTHWSMLVRKGTTLRLTDQEGGANVGMLFYNPLNKLERYNAPDTLKCQHTFKLTAGHCLYSDMGHVFCSIIHDTVGWHDTVGGNLSTAKLESRWGEHSYQQNLNDWTVSGEKAFLVELAKHGLNRRDMSANLNLFSQVKTDDEGNMQFIEENSQAGDNIDLRFEMDTLVVFHTCPHPMNPAKAYPKKPVRYQLRQSEPIAEDDICMTACDENQRGFENNRIYHQQCCHH
ncbi:MAG TPA: urea carboxylase-associated family protein [Methylophaga aminisulfidivorans]|uniref:Urea carboxylase-associated family protein n=1 Tax=Methylophaga aminisulfidivorans TaxID=230105 RepID=A0A7C1VNR8_9GAMM|nr:urea carboxylase-associated family protein [Methylophaga aminisulfidivorans]